MSMGANMNMMNTTMAMAMKTGVDMMMIIIRVRNAMQMTTHHTCRDT